jgi:hypothetical protein
LQTPVPPLQRAADVTPVFNQILMNEQEEEYDGPPQKEIPALIVWTLGGKNVYVEGSWDNWKSRYNNYLLISLVLMQDCNFRLQQTWFRDYNFIYVAGKACRNLGKIILFCWFSRLEFTVTDLL